MANTYIVTRKDGSVVERIMGKGKTYSERVIKKAPNKAKPDKNYSSQSGQEQSVSPQGDVGEPNYTDAQTGQPARADPPKQPVADSRPNFSDKNKGSVNVPPPQQKTQQLAQAAATTRYEQNPGNQPLQGAIDKATRNPQPVPGAVAPRTPSPQETISQKAVVDPRSFKGLYPDRQSGMVRQAEQIKNTWYDKLKNTWLSRPSQADTVGVLAGGAIVVSDVGSAVWEVTGRAAYDLAKDARFIDRSPTGGLKPRIPFSDTAKSIPETPNALVQEVSNNPVKGLTKIVAIILGPKAINKVVPTKTKVVVKNQYGIEEVKTLPGKPLKANDVDQLVKSGAYTETEVRQLFGDEQAANYRSYERNFRESVNDGFDTEFYSQPGKPRISTGGVYSKESQTQLRPNTARDRAFGYTTDVLSPRLPEKSAASIQEALQKTYNIESKQRIENVKVYFENEKIPLQKGYQTSFDEFNPKLEDTRTSFEQVSDLVVAKKRTTGVDSGEIRLSFRRSPMESGGLVTEKQPVTSYENPFKSDKLVVEQFVPDNTLSELRSGGTKIGGVKLLPKTPVPILETPKPSAKPETPNELLIPKKEYPIAKESSKAAVELEQNTAQGLDLVVKQKQETETGTQLSQLVGKKSKGKSKSGMLLNTASATTTDTLLDTAAAQVQKQEQTPKLDTLQDQATTQKSTARSTTFVVKQPPKITTTFPVRRMQPKQVVAKTGKAFSVLVKRGGKWERVNKQPLTEESAIGLGKKITAETSAASFKVVPTTGKAVSLKGINTVSSTNYRKPVRKGVEQKTSNVFIEKNKYRINTGTEKQQITAKGVAVTKSRKGFGKTTKKKRRGVFS